MLSLFEGGITHGRKDFVQRERKIKTAYVAKLRDVMLSIAVDHGDVPDIRELLTSGHPGSVYAYREGPFRVQTPVYKPAVADIVTLQSKVDGRTPLLLDCSLRYFSEGPEPDGTFLLHSGNYRFFTKGLALTMSTVFVVLGMDGDSIVGTPLYLQLSGTTLAAGVAL